ncbi:MAG: response regulator [Proteobacteria bacterium]|nr:response regulator [Pseudomonadota bacterium]
MAQRGILDLRDWNFTRQGSLSLSGQWEFYWNQKIQPEKRVPMTPLPKTTFITVPGSWNSLKIDQEKLPGHGFATYRLTILLNPEATGLGLKLLDMATACQVYANGRQVFSSGYPGTTRETTRPFYAPGVVDIYTPTQTLDILVQVSNFDHWQGGMWEPIVIGPAKQLQDLRKNRLFLDAFLLGSILIMGLYHFCLFWFRPQDKSTLYFGLFCITIAFRTLTHGERYIMELIPDLSYETLLTSVYISVYTCIPLFALYTRSLFPHETSKKIIYGAAAAGGVLSVFVLATPARIFTPTMPVFQIFTLVILAYGVVSVARALLNKRREAGLFLFGFLLLIITIINDILYTRQLIYTGHFVSMGLFIFILFQAVLISRRFSRAYDTITLQQLDLKQEIAQREQITKALAASETRFRQTADFLPIPLWECDLSHKICYANKAASDWFGVSDTGFSPYKSLLDLVSKKDAHRITAILDHFKHGRTSGAIELELIKKDRSGVWGQLTAGPIFTNRELTGGRICFVDLTERKKAEKASLFAAEQEKYALVGQIAGKMAHDFNNILGAIMGNAELSLMDCREKETCDSLGIILEQTKRGQILTQNLVAFAKDQEPMEEFFNINEKIDLVLNLLKKEMAGIHLTKTFEPGLPDLFADPGMIEQALINIFQNSLHAMGLEPNPKLILKTCLKSGKLIVQISDNGCGIPEKHQKDIYTPAFTLKGSKDEAGVYKPDIKGTGYGMSNVKKYIEKHGGEICFKSSPGKGTTFTLFLPVRKNNGPSKVSPVPARDRDMSGKKILVVEDEQAIAKVLENILTLPPFSGQVTLAGDAKTAMSLYDGDVFDLVSLDYMLPGNLNGLDVYFYIRNKNVHIPIVFVSGNLEFMESIEVLKEKDPFLDHLSKPCENTKYIDTICKWLNKKGLSQ